ncbi:MAG: alpha/beta hydrolase [Pseudomonadota bacterium]
MEEIRLTLNGHATRLLRTGAEGPACLFLHGFPEHGGAWAEVFGHLAGVRAWAPDQRGYGTAWRPAEVEPYAVGKLVRDVLQMVTLLGLERVHLVGHDWGASVAYGVAFTQDPRIASLTILNGVHPIPFQRALAAGGPQTVASQYIPWLRRPGSETILAADGGAKLAALFAEGMDMAWLDAARLDTYRAAWGGEAGIGAMVNWYRASPLVVPSPPRALSPDEIPDWPAGRMRVHVPHLLIWGAGDRALLPESTHGLEDHCDDLHRVEIPGTDHWLHHQKPAEVARLIGDFVRGIG